MGVGPLLSALCRRTFLSGETDLDRLGEAERLLPGDRTLGDLDRNLGDTERRRGERPRGDLARLGDLDLNLPPGDLDLDLNLPPGDRDLLLDNLGDLLGERDQLRDLDLPLPRPLGRGLRLERLIGL